MIYLFSNTKELSTFFTLLYASEFLTFCKTMILHLLEAENYMRTRRNLMTIAELYKIVITVMPTSIIINCYY